MTFTSVDELLNAVYLTFGQGVVVEQWGSYFRPLTVEASPTSVVVARTEAPPESVAVALWDDGSEPF